MPPLPSPSSSSGAVPSPSTTSSAVVAAVPSNADSCTNLGVPPERNLLRHPGFHCAAVAFLDRIEEGQAIHAGGAQFALSHSRDYAEYIIHALASKRFGGCISPSATTIHRRSLLRKFAFLAAVFACLVLHNLASAQQADAMLGFGTLMSSSNNTASLSNPTIAEKGGLYPSVSADVIFHRRLGFNFEVAWRASQGIYGGCNGCQPYRPILYDFNAVLQPRLSKKLGADIMGGIGGQSTRFYGYIPTSNCVYFGAC